MWNGRGARRSGLSVSQGLICWNFHTQISLQFYREEARKEKMSSSWMCQNKLIGARYQSKIVFFLKVTKNQKITLLLRHVELQVGVRPKSLNNVSSALLNLQYVKNNVGGSEGKGGSYLVLARYM